MYQIHGLRWEASHNQRQSNLFCVLCIINPDMRVINRDYWGVQYHYLQRKPNVGVLEIYPGANTWTTGQLNYKKLKSGQGKTILTARSRSSTWRAKLTKHHPVLEHFELKQAIAPDSLLQSARSQTLLLHPLSLMGQAMHRQLHQDPQLVISTCPK